MITNVHKCINNITNFKKSKFILFIHKICSHALNVLVEEACSCTLDSAGFAIAIAAAKLRKDTLKYTNNLSEYQLT